MSKESTVPKNKRHRSRNFPILGLEEAIGLVHTLRKIEGSNFTPTSVAVQHWDISSKSSMALRVPSALIQYGLLEDEGMGKARSIRASTLAVKILNHPDPEERQKAIQEAALKPDIYREIWERYKGQLPSNKSLKWDLTGKGDPLKGDINENSVGRFIKSFRATLEFSGLIGDGTIEDGSGEKQEPIGEPEAETPVGSLSPTPSKGEQHMPSTDAKTRTNFDIPIPLGDQLQGTLRLPNPMTEEEWSEYVSVIEKTKALKIFLVRGAPKEETTETDEGSTD